MIKAAIFDMDGTMINSEPLQSQAFKEVVRMYGKTPKPYKNGMMQVVGVKEKENWEIIKKRHGIDEDTKVLLEKRNKVYLRILKKNLRPARGLLTLIKLLKNKKITMALASSSKSNHVKAVLSGLNLKKTFAAVLTAEDVKKGKPHPDVFLQAAKKLKVDPKECVVFEDAQSGVEAGQNAKMHVIVVINKYTKRKDFPKNIIKVDSLAKINWKMLEKLQ